MVTRTNKNKRYNFDKKINCTKLILYIYNYKVVSLLNLFWHRKSLVLFLSLL